MNVLQIDKLKANARRLPEGFLDYVLTHGRTEGNKLILDNATIAIIGKKFPTLGQTAVNIAKLKANARRFPEGYVDYVLAVGKIDGDKVILDKKASQRVGEAFPTLDYTQVDVAKLKANAALWPEEFVDSVLSRGKVVGNNVILDPRTRMEIQARFSTQMPMRFALSRLREARQQWPAGFVDYVLAYGAIEGDWVIISAKLKEEIHEKFPELARIKLNISQLRSHSAQFPAGYVDEVLACGKIEGDLVVLDLTAQKNIRSKFPQARWRIPNNPLQGGGPSRSINWKEPVPDNPKSPLGKIPPRNGANLPQSELTRLISTSPPSEPSRIEGCTNSPKISVSSPVRNLVVYTVILDHGVTLIKPPDHWLDKADFIVFQEKASTHPGWQHQPLHQKNSRPEYNLLRHKTLPHRYFPDAEYSLWMDSSLLLKSTAQVDRWITDVLRDHDLAVFRNPLRNCCYQEAAECIQQQHDDPTVIDRQMKKYFKDGYPVRNGLADCSVLLRRHTQAIKQFNELWHKETKAHSTCDQLSLDYAAHVVGVKYAVFPGAVFNNPHFSRRPPTAPLPTRKAVWSSISAAFEKPDVIILSHPRSGTHFLESSLGSHPKVHTRDEFMRRYAWTGRSELRNFINVKARIYSNKPHRFNIGIVMYQDVLMFEKLFCPLTEVKVLHLLRNPAKIARSFSQMWADLLLHGKKYKYHYTNQQEPLSRAPVTIHHIKDVTAEIHMQMAELKVTPSAEADLAHLDFSDLAQAPTVEKGLQTLQATIASMQSYFSTLLANHPDKFVVNYDEITQNSQVNELPTLFCEDILRFLGLEYRQLTNGLKKTG